MELKIKIDESLQEMNGEINGETFSQLQALRNIKKVNDEYFQLGDLERPTAIISISSEPELLDNVLYVDQTLKSVYYPKTALVIIE
jgi:hypothetical protein